MYIHNIVQSVTGLLDKCINRKYSTKETLLILNTVFSGRKVFTKKDINQRKIVHEANKKILDKLIKLPIVQQKSPEWYDIRKNLITASDFAQALGKGKFGTQKQLYKKKCGFEEEQFNPNLPPLKWGNMFEFVAQTIYSQRNNVKIYEFGIIKHPKVDFFGASPDGITENGIMLEIKCPFKRKINGEIPVQYYYQIQGQLDVCELTECDYFECEFELVESRNELLNSSFECGAIIETSDNKYLYSEIKTEWKEEELETLNTWINENKTSDDNKIYYYRLITCNTLRVEKDDVFVKENLEQLREVWNKIKEYRSDEELYNKELNTQTPKKPTECLL